MDTIYKHGLTIRVVDRRHWWKLKKSETHISEWPLELEGPSADQLVAHAPEWDLPALLCKQAG